MFKKGLSGVVTTLIIILLVVVAVGIIWFVIKNVITKGTEEVELGKFTLDLEIKKSSIKINTDNTASVRIQRNQGKGDLSGVKITLSDGMQTQVYETDVNLDELEDQLFTIPLTDVGMIKTVSVYPMTKTESGENSIGGLSDQVDFSYEESIERDEGLAHWWRFESDLKDDIGGNKGEEIVGEISYEDGKVGKAGDFDGDMVVELQDSFTLDKDDSAFAWWMKAGNLIDTSLFGNHRAGVYPKSFINYYNNGLEAETNLDNDYFTFWDDEKDTVWKFYVISFENANPKLYVNGDFLETANYAPIEDDLSLVYFGGEANPSANYTGLIDEVRVYNKALTANQIKSLYNLDISES